MQIEPALFPQCIHVLRVTSLALYKLEEVRCLADGVVLHSMDFKCLTGELLCAQCGAGLTSVS